MSDREVEDLLARAKEGPRFPEPSGIHLPPHEALAHRDSGNVPDDAGRVLRLVLHMTPTDDPRAIHEKRLQFEPDFHSAPRWRRAGSRPVNVVPLGMGSRRTNQEAWWEDADMARLEAQWTKSGVVEGIKVPAEYRSFVYKTIVALQRDGIDVSALTVADSVARWLPEGEAAALRAALEDAKE
ncbi:MAG: hypothetical protein QOH90_467, partial [Actinomycetota bacterium]|nr:hypothetical protein [Actinomycetota bacterium]